MHNLPMQEGGGGPLDRIGLVGCVKSKLGHAARAQDLYTSPLFQGRRRWVEQTCGRWFILSAKHGLLYPDTVIAPYDLTLRQMPARERRAWSRRVVEALREELHDFRSLSFEAHLGSAYWDHGLREGLLREGAKLEVPFQHLGLGLQLARYREGPPGRGPAAG